MWDIKSVILYLVMASIGYFCISEERRSIQNGVRRRLKVSYAILFFVWLFLAVYRYVGYESGIIIGGNDAPTYIDYFQTCLAGKGNNIYFVRTEPLFQILSYKKVNGQLQEMEELEKEKLRMLQMMCYFDLMLIPICYILGIWRGASYFFLPRLLILGYIITDFSRKISKNSRKAYYMIVKVAMPIWLVLRLFTVYDVSGLMPYYLDFRL